MFLPVNQLRTYDYFRGKAYKIQENKSLNRKMGSFGQNQGGKLIEWLHQWRWILQRVSCISCGLQIDWRVIWTTTACDSSSVGLSKRNTSGELCLVLGIGHELPKGGSERASKRSWLNDIIALILEEGHRRHSRYTVALVSKFKLKFWTLDSTKAGTGHLKMYWTWNNVLITVAYRRHTNVERAW